MRNKYIYNIKNINDLLINLLFQSKYLDCVSILLSNIDVKDVYPADYVEYDLIAGIDSIVDLSTSDNSFLKLKNFHEENLDWMFGYLSYDLKNELENLSSSNKDNIEANNLNFFIPRYVLLLKGHKLEVLTYENRQKVDILFKNMKKPIRNRYNIILEARENKADYLKKIAKIKKHIQRGDIYEMNYCMEYFCHNVDVSPEILFFDLNREARTPFSVFFHMNDHYIISASPERFLKRKNEKLLSQPIKGTIKRGNNDTEDKALINELLASKKDISENIMITDLVRNDFSKIACKSSVNVEELCKVYKFNHIHQMISTISAKVDQNKNFTEILKSAFPMGSMTGAPKIRAMELIDHYEEFNRGIYSGAAGYISPSGNFDFNVIIRTIIYNIQKKYISVSVGGAITANSEPEKEYEECLLKLKPILEVLSK